MVLGGMKAAFVRPPPRDLGVLIAPSRGVESLVLTGVHTLAWTAAG